MITFELQINNFEISISSDELFYYVSVIDYTYSATDAMNNIINYDNVLSYGENDAPLIRGESDITNNDIIDFLLSRVDFTQIKQELTIQLSVIANPVTYTWYIYEMENIPNYNGQQNFVSKIYWRYNAVSNDGFVANIESISTFNEQNGTNYTQYFDLTQDIVIGWLETSNDMSDLQYKLNSIINEKRNPPVVVLPLPW